jgi:hypothetical protein
MWAIGGGVASRPRGGGEENTEPCPRRRSFHGTITTRKTRKPILVSTVSSTAGHVRGCHREFPPIHHSSDNADLTLAAGDLVVHLRDIVVVSNGLKDFSTFPPSGSLTISMASTPHIALPRNSLRTQTIPSILEMDIADVVKVSHQPTLISPVATMRASQMPGEAFMSLME